MQCSLNCAVIELEIWHLHRSPAGGFCANYYDVIRVVTVVMLFSLLRIFARNRLKVAIKARTIYQDSKFL